MSIKLLFGTNWPQLVGHQTSLTLQDYFGVLFRPGGNVSIDNEQSDLQLCVWWWWGGVGAGNKRNLLLRAYQPLCGEMERDVGEETGVVIVRMNCYCCLSGFSLLPG